jgi:hypothetical protein
MNRNLFALILFGIPQLACGASPLLNHRSPVRNQALTGPADAAPDSCSLRFERSDLCGRLEWVRFPTEEETGIFLLRFTRVENGSSLPADAPAGLRVAVKLWMPDMGHGSSPVKVVRPLDSSGVPETGLYRAESVHFSMPGAWEIRVIFRNESGTPVDQAVLPYQAG